MTLPLAFDTQGFPVVNALLPGGLDAESSDAGSLGGFEVHTGPQKSAVGISQLAVLAVFDNGADSVQIEINWYTAGGGGVLRDVFNYAGADAVGTSLRVIPCRAPFYDVRITNLLGVPSSAFASYEIYTIGTTALYGGVGYGGVDPLNAAATPPVGTFRGGWQSLAAYPELNLYALSDVGSAVGGLQIQWSFDGTVENAALRDTFDVAAATPFDLTIARKAPFYRIEYTSAGAETALELRATLYTTPASSGGVDSSPGGLGTGLAYTFVADASIQIATVVPGTTYRICVEGGAGCVINTRDGVADRATDQAYWAYDNWDSFTATRPDVFGQTLIAGSAFSTVKLIPVD